MTPSEKTVKNRKKKPSKNIEKLSKNWQKSIKKRF
jgi:hypothetical protein